MVLEKRVYANEVESGRTSACRYQLRVKFEDGGHVLASAAVGDIIPVRYNPGDRSQIELDR